MVEKSTNLEHLNEKLMQYTKEMEASNSRIEILSKKIQELDNERLSAEAKVTDMSNKNHELTKLLQKMKDSISKKEQVIARTLKIEKTICIYRSVALQFCVCCRF